MQTDLFYSSWVFLRSRGLLRVWGVAVCRRKPSAALTYGVDMSEKVSTNTQRRRQVRFVVVAVCSVFAFILCAAPLMNGVRWAPLAPVLAFRHLPLAILCLGGIGWTVFALASRKRAAERIGAIAVTCILIGQLIFFASASTTYSPSKPVETGPANVRILIWNTNQDQVQVAVIADLVRRTNPDIIVLPEYFGQISRAVSSALPSGEYKSHWTENSAATIWTDKKLGSYRVVTKGVPAWAGFVAEPTNSASTAPKLVVAHLQRADLVSDGLWNEHLNWVASECDGPNVVAAGDFNTSSENLTNAALGTCHDAATALHATGAGTWPTTLPAFLGTQIDRVMTGMDWIPARFQVLGTEDGAGSDHRPVVVDLVRRRFGSH